MRQEQQRGERPREEWVLEQVIAGKANPEVAPYVIGVSSTELRSMLVGLIDRRAKEQGWPTR